MSTQAVSSVSIYQELQSFTQNRQSDLQSLGTALQSGNLNAAQQSYQQLVSLGQSGPFSNSEPFNQTARANDFEAIGQALSSGDLAGAQTAFATLQQSVTPANGSGAITVDPPTAALNTASSQSNVASASSVSSASGTSGLQAIYQQVQAFLSDSQADLLQLGTDSSPDNSDSSEQNFQNQNFRNQDFQNLVQLEQASLATPQSSAPSNSAAEFQALGLALQSGNLANAQQAFTTLQNTFGNIGDNASSSGSPTLQIASLAASSLINAATQSQNQVSLNVQG
jgi:hypothetical protein